MSTVFYSWQKDLPNRCNRGLIETALHTAVKQLREDPDVVNAPREIDKDTSGVPGSPDIAGIIFEKIKTADACVFDVSIAIRCEGQRVSPNPNVLVELGYAMHAHPFQRVILVFNTAYGDPEELPFDLRARRVLPYHALEGQEDLASARDGLARALVAALRDLYGFLATHRYTHEELEFYLLLYNNLRAVLDAAVELQDRSLGNAFQQLQAGWLDTARNLRALSAEDVARSNQELGAKIDSLAEKLSGLANWRPMLPNERKIGVQEAAAEARALVAWCVPPLRQKFSSHNLARDKRQVCRRVLDEYGRYCQKLEQKESQELQSIRSTLSYVGAEVLQLCSELEVLEDADAALFRAAGHALHVANIRKSEAVGFGDHIRVRNGLEPLVRKLEGFQNIPAPQ